MNPIIALLFVFIASFFAPVIVRRFGRVGPWLPAAIPAIMFFMLLRYIPDAVHGHGQQFTLEWLPALGISLTLYLDGLALFFALIISFMGILIYIYATGYFHHHPFTGRFYLIVTIFMGAMLGVVLSGNLFTLFIFWELTSFSSYLLIGFNNEKEESRWAALQSLLVTGGGGLALFAGIILIRIVGGSFELHDVLLQSDILKSHSLYAPIIILLALGAFTKSAQAPFHFWLPGAMAAPTPVSAYLHSATMVKAGLYLMARFSPILGGTDLWFTLVTLVGATTMVTGALQALPQTDLKKLLAYTTISALGMIMMLIGLGTPLAIKAGMVFLLVHSLYKGSLFMVAGGLDHQAGTRDTQKLSGLGRLMPLTAAAGILAALAMSGIPPFLGFIAKELLYEAKLHAPLWPILFVIAGLFANAVNVTVAIATGIRPFFGKVNESISQAKEGGFGLWFGPLLPASLGLVFGLLPGIVAAWLYSPAVSSIVAKSTHVHLQLWHGFSIVLLLSAFTLMLGYALFKARPVFINIRSRGWALKRLSPSFLFKAGLEGFLNIGEKATNFLQSGNLRYYLIIVFGVVSVSVWVKLISTSSKVAPNFQFTGLNYFEVGLVLIMIAAAFFIIRTPSRLSAVAGLGIVGFGVALIYLLYSAPDVAITQFLVETLAVVLFVLVLYRLPAFKNMSPRKSRLYDAILAASIGLMVTVVVILEAIGDSLPTISQYYAEHSVAKAHGHNIVNVILVDFRGIDTMGEITVLAVAALGVYALMKLRLSEKEK